MSGVCPDLWELRAGNGPEPPGPVIWIYAMNLDKTPKRRQEVKDRNHYAFSDVRRDITETVMTKDFRSIWSPKRKSVINSIAAALLRMAA